jgi:hypothetical protein
MLRVDHVFTDSFKIYGRYTQDALSVRNPYGGTSLSAVTTSFPGLAVTDGTRPGRNFVLNATHMVSPTLLQQLQYTLARRFTDFHPASDNTNRRKLGITLPELFPDNAGDVIPNISLGSNYATLAPYRVAAKQLFNMEFSDHFAMVFPRHTVKFGAYYAYG